MKNLYFVEVTDVYGGEANYSWVTRHAIYAKSERGVAHKMARRTGLKWRYDGIKYVSKSGATCFFVEDFGELHDMYRLDTDERSGS
jgi:hypothetical protein